MGTKTDNATTLFASGFACSQAILAAFCEQYGLDRETALKLACGLGGGVKCAEVCGAVSGAVLVVGLKYGQVDVLDKEARRVCSMKTAEFLSAFKARNSHLTCRDLLGCDISTVEGRAKAVEEGLFTTRCVALVTDAAGILEDMGY
ncbi:MAG: C-GCAxxG-C-C family protein [Planctomycetes bacterium]|nr:C-GCAxxG-C-C family protein [Planctomycetota bacterium]